MSVPAARPTDTTVDLKNPWLAAGLALLLPGLGHFYQGRTFKAAVYFICILGLFFTGQALGEWKVVYLSDSEAGGRFAAGGGLVKRLLQGYGAQFPVGAFAWPAVIQSRRYHAPENVSRVHLDEPMEAAFRGGIWVDTANGSLPIATIEGTITLKPVGTKVTGEFIGTDENGKPVTLTLDDVTELGQPISANEDRTVEAEINPLPEGLEIPPGADTPYLKGGIDRPFWNRYQVPLGDLGEDTLTAKLGGQLEIAYVFTWIAGLLNVLAIWDALDGPAYGIGHEPELNEKKRRRKNKDATGDSTPKLDPRPEPAERVV